jgi:hypothetical protein
VPGGAGGPCRPALTGSQLDEIVVWKRGGHEDSMAGPIPAASGRIFISYRREETAYPAAWLFNLLADRFGGGLG